MGIVPIFTVKRLNYLDPPGHQILKQLEVECASKHQSHTTQPNITPHQPTPVTPSISSLHRHHPIANFQSYHHSPTNNLYNSPVNNFTNSSVDNAPPPPPPPLPLGSLMERQSSVSTPPPPPPSIGNYENVSPSNHLIHGKNEAQLPTVKKMKHNNTSHTAIPNHRRRNYSPVSNSDQSNSPRSPSRNYEAISDSEPQVEDISPANSPVNPTKTKENDDDAMSLSSISSGEDHKVELNVQSMNSMSNDKKSLEQSQPINPNIPPASVFPMLRPPPAPQEFVPPPNMYPPSQNNLSQQIQTPNVNYMRYPGTPSQFPPTYQNQPMNSHNLSNHNSMVPAPLSGPPPSQPQPQRMAVPQTYLTQRHSEILQNALLGNTRTASSLINNQQNLISPIIQQQQQQRPPPSFPNLPLHQQQSAPVRFPHVPTQTIPNQNIPNQINQQHYVDNTLVNPSLMEELPFIFQVKAGCARDISKELKRILGKDTLKKLVEQSAFKAFENWYERQKQQHENSSTLTESTTTNVTNKIPEQRKTDNNVIQSNNTTNKGTTSDLLQSLFGRDKNNENRPPSSFLGSFRISRRPQASNNVKNVNKKSGKRRPWPSLDETKRKHQRIEDSDDEYDVMNYDHKDEGADSKDEEDQLEQFALQQRKFFVLFFFLNN